MPCGHTNLYSGSSHRTQNMCSRIMVVKYKNTHFKPHTKKNMLWKISVSCQSKTNYLLLIILPSMLSIMPPRIMWAIWNHNLVYHYPNFDKQP